MQLNLKEVVEMLCSERLRYSHSEMYQGFRQIEKLNRTRMKLYKRNARSEKKLFSNPICMLINILVKMKPSRGSVSYANINQIRALVRHSG